MERATRGCCFELQEIGPPLHSMMKPEIDFRDLHMAQSESLNDLKMGSVGFGVW